MKKILFINVIAAIGFTLLFALTSSCSRKCPAYPREVAGFLPLNRQNREVVYVSSSGDSVTMYGGKPDYSGKYKIRFGVKCTCEATVTQEVVKDESNYIHYTNRMPLSDCCYLTVDINAFGIWDSWWVLATDKGEVLVPQPEYSSCNTEVEKIASWRSSAGVLYDTVYKVWERVDNADSLYFIPGEGLVQIDLQNGQTWTLQ